MNLLHKRDFVASPYKSERDKLIYVKRMDVRRFFKLLGKCDHYINITNQYIIYIPIIRSIHMIAEKLNDFFEDDKCCRLADNYLIAMAFTYFLRASFEPEEYTRQNFFVAL